MLTSTLFFALASTALALPIAKRSVAGTNAGSLYSYDPAPTSRAVFYQYGSCGLSTYFAGVVPDTMPLVAMPSTVMANYGASQDNTLCGKIITMTDSNGVTKEAAVADTNVSDTDSIDMTEDVWVAFGQSASDASIIKALDWSVNVAGSSSASTVTSTVTSTPKDAVTLTTTTAAAAVSSSTSSSSSSSTSGSCTQTYTAVSGDYCYLIWNEFGITEAQLYAWNPTLDAACDLAIGQVLCVAE